MSTAAGESVPGSDARPRGFYAWLVLLLGAGTVTRLYRLTEWGLAGDEMYTLRDSLEIDLQLLEQPLQLLFRRPLLFMFNRYLVSPFAELDASTLRILPVIFGILGIAVLVLVGRRLVGDRAALLGGVLLVFNPWHLQHSQFARYYSLVFLLATLAPAALYLGVREEDRRWLLVGVLCAVLAWLAHPTGILPTGGFVVWLGVVALGRLEGRRRTLVLWGLGLTGIVGVTLGVVMLSDWAALGQEWGIEGVWVAVSWTSRLGAPVAVAAAGGIVLLWMEGRRSLSLFLALAVGVPLATLAVLGRYVSVHTGYLFATAPYALLAAGAFVDRVPRVFESRARRAVVTAALAGAVVAGTLPGFVSHYLDGGRPDFRGAAGHVAARAGPADSVLTDQPFTLGHYAPALRTGLLHRSPSRLDSALADVRANEATASLWVVPYVRSQGGFSVRGLGAAQGWVWRNCQLDGRLGAHRLDHELNRVTIWRCPGARGAVPGDGPDADSPG